MFEKPSAADHGEHPASGPRLPERTATARATTNLLSDAHELLWQAGDAELTELMDTLGALTARAEALRVAVAAEAEDRGIVAASTAAGTAQWVSAHSSHLEPGEAHRIARLATALRDARNEEVTAALLAGRASTRCADLALKEVDKIAPLVPDASRGEALGWFLDVAGTGGRREIDRLTRWVIGRFGGNALELQADKARRLSGITLSHLPGGHTRYVMDLAPNTPRSWTPPWTPCPPRTPAPTPTPDRPSWTPARPRNAAPKPSSTSSTAPRPPTRPPRSPAPPNSSSPCPWPT